MPRKGGKLTKLDLSGKRLSTLTGVKGLEPSSHAYKVKLTGNLFETIPTEELSRLDVRELDVSKNCLQMLPFELTSLQNLEVLNLSYNKIQAIGDELLPLVNLRVLDLSNNLLPVVPPVVAQMMSLESLKLSKNLLHILPTSLTVLTNLQELDVSGNPLISPSHDVVSKGSVAILNHLKLISNTIGASINQFGPLPRGPYVAEWIKPTPDSPSSSRSAPKVLFTKNAEAAPVVPSSFYVSHSVFADQGCRDYMEDTHVAINHIILPPYESKRRRRKTENAKLASSPSKGSTVDSHISVEMLPIESTQSSQTPNSASSEGSQSRSDDLSLASVDSNGRSSPESRRKNGDNKHGSSAQDQRSPGGSSKIEISKKSRSSSHSSSDGRQESVVSMSVPNVITSSLPAPKLSRNMSVAVGPNQGNVRRSNSSAAMSQFASTPNLFSSVPTMEMEGECVALFAVFDGHAGHRCSKFMRDHFGKIFFDLKATRRGEIPVGLYKAFLKAETQFCQVAKVAGWNDGSTGVVSVIHGHQLTLAHIGDSRAVLCRGKQAIELTADHKPDRPDEHERIISLGGTVERAEMGGSIPRVNGHLAVSRAFGDIRMKESQRFVSAEPEISVFALNPEDKFIVIASDGLWDVLTNQEAVDFIRKDSVKHKAAKNLVKRALRIGTTDNITALVVWLTWVGNTPVPVGLSSSSSGQLISNGSSTAPLPSISPSISQTDIAISPSTAPSTPSPPSTSAATTDSEENIKTEEKSQKDANKEEKSQKDANKEEKSHKDANKSKSKEVKRLDSDKPSSQDAGHKESKEPKSKDQRQTPKTSKELKEPTDQSKAKSPAKSKDPSGSPPPLSAEAPLENPA